MRPRTKKKPSRSTDNTSPVRKKPSEVNASAVASGSFGIGRGGLDREILAAYLASDEDRELVIEKDIEIRKAGVSGVPFFIFNRKLAVSGAHEPDTLLKAMLESVSEKPAANA